MAFDVGLDLHVVSYDNLWPDPQHTKVQGCSEYHKSSLVAPWINWQAMGQECIARTAQYCRPEERSLWRQALATMVQTVTWLQSFEDRIFNFAIFATRIAEDITIFEANRFTIYQKKKYTIAVAKHENQNLPSSRSCSCTSHP